MTEEEFRVSIGAYLLGALEPGEVLEVQQHLTGCADCQREYLDLTEVLPALAALPRELTDAEPYTDADDLVLRRALRQIEKEERRARHRPWLRAAGVAAAAVLVGTLVGMAVLTPPSSAPGPTQAVQDSSASVSAVRTVSGTNAATQVDLIATLSPDGTGTRVLAQLSGARPGMTCRLVVTARSSQQLTAGSARVAAPPASTWLAGTVSLPVDQVSELRVLNSKGQVLVTARL